MESIRKWFYRPKRDDTSLLAQFFYADESLNAVACELDSFDGRQEPERCTTLVNQLRHCQDKVLTICNQIMDELIPESRANRDFRVKFPDDVMQENLAGQLWFGAECLAAGSSIMNREAESSAMRPLAKALTKSLELVRNLLREHALKGHMNLKAQNQLEPSIEKLIESLKIFDRLFADFELCYVGAMVPVKSTKEYEQQELVCVLFSETLQRALERGLLSQSDVDNYEPALMFTIPRLAIVAGLLAPPGGPLCLNSPDTISEMFRPFRNLLLKIRELLWTLNNRELHMLEKLLCSNEEPSVAPISRTAKTTGCQELPDVDEFVNNFYTDYPYCKDFIVDFYTITRNTGANMDEIANDAVRILDENGARIDYPIVRGTQPSNVRNGPDVKSPDVREIENSLSKRENSNDATVTSQTIENSYVNEQPTGIIHQQQELQSSPLSTSVDQSSKFNEAELVTDRIQPNQTASRTDVTEAAAAAAPPSFEIEDFSNPDISQILGNQTDIIEIPQTRYLLNQVSHENNISGETINVENSLPDLDSQKLITEANKTLSNLLLDADCRNELSEQTDSGICTVISSENTSLYDKSPEEKIFSPVTNDDDDDDESAIITYDEANENTSYSCSNFVTPKRKNSTNAESSSCVCGTRVTRNLTSYEACTEVSNNRTSCSDELMKNVARISSSFNGTSEEFVGMAYGTGQLAVCDANPSNFQLNYSENWETLNFNIDATRSDSSRREFWNELKCKNCPSASKREITRIDGDIERYGQVRIAARRVVRDGKARRRHQRKFERRSAGGGGGAKKCHDDSQRGWSTCNVRGCTGGVVVRRATASSESSRSNSTDRCLNPRFASFGASLHPSHNTRKMPNFGSQSPQPSPRLCHFEPRADTSGNSSAANAINRVVAAGKSSSSQSRKLLDHRRSRSEQIARMKRNAIDATTSRRRNDDTEVEVSGETTELRCEPRITKDLRNDGLGRRTDRSGLVVESTSPEHETSRGIVDSRDNDTRRGPKVLRSGVSGGSKRQNSRLGTTNEGPASSSYSSCCDSSSETSEFQSDCQDDEEIALAMQAAEIANRNQIRAKFRSSEDLVHRLFVCIAGVADQLQTNFASDLRNILKCVFLMNSSQTIETKNEEPEEPSSSLDIQTPDSPVITETSENNERQDSLQELEEDEEFEETTPTNERGSPVTECGEECVERAPAWIPDNDAPRCMACQAGFTVVRRRHHCRNCGKVFCGRCSSNNVPLPRYGHAKPVRVCNRCFIYQVMPFTVSQVTPAS